MTSKLGRYSIMRSLADGKPSLKPMTAPEMPEVVRAENQVRKNPYLKNAPRSLFGPIR
jgi:hypothetical protein